MSIISSSDVLIDAILQTTNPKSQILIRDGMEKGVEEVACNTLEQRLASSIEEWEVEEAEPLCIQQHLTTQKEKEISVWVKQNLIRLGKLLGADFQGHEQEALELLLQVDSARQARHQDAAVVCKKTRFKGSKELKSLVAFDVKFKCGGGKEKGRNFLTIS
ncbi:hypothetical protein MTR67_044639 [Solanum verrucosum]|uniref:Uncharacterized protein n=1 Tax=Solanum verrucosum TaxID=315347 RepID=A0AAF0UTT5_SOLVR|nr:hypothetical protein MTR67_044639 [Solanum verrucosum]